ncbi:MAG: PEP-CTERM-box response regulator transcription factor [Desulfomonilia bacterium]|jgi:two-component system NtrC family response regulator|uniref:Regulatory protein AtoC n=1 Tax=anaerobic digester metagenome TaxID=1263854 RepID=A0A485M304_9ZZZZ|nr:PEP-CTERM-box response regulator transcription factor [Pseudomonadota bacterium]HPD21259.1 PEP-CTERM-box response regulator transcription factor [Deltaproteobacteria bacterium]HPX19801.1 PEP-CTERM-box response regulator transcription factor [Deltaproteobacteria bacterium]HRS55747.1 PEP-CTERM-box response regulator transcription factor [Desulfomonilia bacterium]HRV34489.1 PEP-CTERM-box response regulator transcription factor [Desulfomonilia bacterium]
MDKEHILIVEDETSMAKQLKWGLADVYDVSVAGDARQAMEIIDARPPLAVLLDLGLPPDPDGATEGLRLLEKIMGVPRPLKVIVITGNTHRDVAVKAISKGAYDYHQKPVNIEELKIVLKRACYLSRLEQHVTELEEAVTGKTTIEGMIATSKPMLELIERARRVARTSYPVLIQGQSGTGKERLARAIHQLGDRSEKPLVIVDCGAIPENLLESELFGHEKGSFTGAHARQIGKLERAQHGTVVLDEIGELPLTLQVKLLRFLQEGTIERIGGKEPIRVDARVIAVTNVDLTRAVKEGLFREDLYYRLNVVPLYVPALKERTDDIPVLAKHFLDTYSQEIGPRIKGFSSAAMDAITAYDWPGNIREMQNRIRRGVVMAEGDWIEPRDIDLEVTGGEVKSLKEIRDEAEAAAISLALARNNYNITRAAIDLDISRPTLHDLIKKHNITIQK